MYLCEAAPAANRASFFALASRWYSALSGPFALFRRDRTGHHFIHQLLDRRQ
jgi:hypothetical protein